MYTYTYVYIYENIYRWSRISWVYPGVDNSPGHIFPPGPMFVSPLCEAPGPMYLQVGSGPGRP